jgi:hypothetical protein
MIFNAFIRCAPHAHTSSMIRQTAGPQEEYSGVAGIGLVASSAWLRESVVHEWIEPTAVTTQGLWHLSEYQPQQLLRKCAILTRIAGSTSLHIQRRFQSGCGRM